MLVKILAPVIALQLALQAYALYDLWKGEEPRGGKLLWGVIILLLGVLGPIIYYAVGRG
ncbi:MAG TPA: PLDc_N domain-containing protein [Candidatus Bathyarchaeota archaeon]|nr:PLDc_N domain-containing protein [Candidatus Bathyarchaeota archaeon]